MYYLLWNNEIIESGIETIEEARLLREEYRVAYGGTVQIIEEV